MRRSTGSHDHAGHATRATTEKILRLLKADSAHAAELHEEIPDWVDIERRPAGWVATPAYRPRPTAPPPKPKEITMPKAPTIPSPQTSADRRRVQAALESAGIKAATCARLIGVNSGNLVRWLKKGKGMSAEKLEPVYAWCDQVEAGTWVAPIDGRKLPRRRSENPNNSEAKAMPQEPEPRDIVEWFREEGQGVNETPKGCRLTCGKTGAWVVQHTGGRYRSDNLDAARAELAAIRDEEPTFDPEPYPETSLESACERAETLEERGARTAQRLADAQERLAYEMEEANRLVALKREPDPCAYVLELWAAQKLLYTMETAGFRMPEGYRFRVTVERA